MKSNFFTESEIELILDQLDQINEEPDTSLMYSRIGHQNYAYWYDSVYEKLESYCSLTSFCVQEIEVVLDALLPVLQYCSGSILSVADSASRKSQNIREALLRAYQ